MKIDFNGSYQQVSRLLNTPAGAQKAQATSALFGELLADLSPDKGELAGIVEQKDSANGLGLTVPADRDSPMASFKFQLPDPTIPSIDKMEPETPATGVENLTRESVKGPAVLKVERVPLTQPLADLKKSERVSEVKKMLETYGHEQGIDPLLGLAVISKESAFNPNAVSQDGFASKGLFQLLDNTGKSLFEQSGKGGKYDPFNPQMNVELGVNHLRYLHDIFSSKTELSNSTVTVPAANSSSLEKLAVAAFNAGEGRVAAAQQRAIKAGKEASQYEDIEAYLPQSTQEYVRNVIAERDALEGPSIG